MGIGIKVETNGASGGGNQLTAEDIRKAKAAIIAADKAVEMDRSDGKPLINRPVADGIRKTEELINLALPGEAEVHRAANGAKAATASNENKALVVPLYKHSDEWCISNAAICYWRWYHDCPASLIDGALVFQMKTRQSWFLP